MSGMQQIKKIFEQIVRGDWQETKPPEHRHAVIVSFTYFRDNIDALFELAEKLDNEINEKGVGTYDGHEIAMDLSHGFLYMYGPDAESLFKTVKPILEQTDFTRGAVVNLRFGEPGSDAHEIEVEIER